MKDRGHVNAIADHVEQGVEQFPQLMLALRRRLRHQRQVGTSATIPRR